MERTPFNPEEAEWETKKVIDDYKFKLQKAEQDISTCQTNVSIWPLTQNIGAIHTFGYAKTSFTSDESELSWLEPYSKWLELKGFRLGSAWLVTFFTSARNRKFAENEPKFDSQLKTLFLINFYNTFLLKIMQLNHSIQLKNYLSCYISLDK